MKKVNGKLIAGNMPEVALPPPDSPPTYRFGTGVTGVGEGVTGVGEGFTGVAEGLTGVGEGVTGVGEGVTGVGEGVTGVREGGTGVAEGVTGVGVEVHVLEGVILRTGVLDGNGGEVKVAVGRGGMNGRSSACPVIMVVSDMQLAFIISCTVRCTARLSRYRLSPDCTVYTTHPGGGPQPTIVRVGFGVALAVGVGVMLGVRLGVIVAVGRGGRTRVAPSIRVATTRQFPCINTLTETPRFAARSLNLSPAWILYNSHPGGTGQLAKVGVGVTITGLKLGAGVVDGCPGSGVSSNTGRVIVGWAVGIDGTKPSVIATKIAPRTIRLVAKPEIKPTETSLRLFMKPLLQLHPWG